MGWRLVVLTHCRKNRKRNWEVRWSSPFGLDVVGCLWIELYVKSTFFETWHSISIKLGEVIAPNAARTSQNGMTERHIQPGLGLEKKPTCPAAKTPAMFHRQNPYVYYLLFKNVHVSLNICVICVRACRCVCVWQDLQCVYLHMLAFGCEPAYILQLEMLATLLMLSAQFIRISD